MRNMLHTFGKRALVAILSLCLWPAMTRAANLTIVSAETRGNSNAVTVTFSAPVSSASATNLSNYVITPSITVSNVSLLEAVKVRLHTGLLTQGQVYTLTVNGVTDTAEPPNAIPPNSQHAFLLTQGGIIRREFHDINGVLLSNLTNNAKFTSNQPDATSITPSLEAPPDVRDDYGVQFLGYITAPITGDYTFYLSSDDQGALFLSSNDQPANKLLIAEEPVWNGSRQFINGANQGSRIQPGVEFFADALFIEAEDFDYGGGLFVSGIPIGMDGPYAGGAYAGLGTLADANIDWHEENPNSESSVHRPGTGVEMGETAGFLNGSRGAFSVTQNFDVGWNDAGDWMNYTRDFPEPARDYHVFAALASGGGNIAARLDEVTAGSGTTNQTRSELGQFNAPPTGGWNSYTLVPLQNATNGIARVNLGGRRTVRFTTLPGSLNVDYVMLVPAGAGEPDLSALRPKNISAPIQLQAGQRYFVEALMKEGGGGDNLAVAWRKPGDVAVTNGTPPIPGEFLSGLAPSEPAVIASQPQSQVVAEYSTVIMTVALTGTMPYDYQWYRDGEMLIGENGPELVLPSVSAAISNTTFHVVCGNGLNSIRSQDASLGVTADLVAPELVFAEGRASLDEVGVGFSEPIDAADAVNVERYQISGGVTILSATLWGNQRLVVLKTSPQTPGQTYTVTVNGIYDRAASRNVVAPNSQLTFTGFDASLPVSPLPVGYQRITVTTRTGPVTVVIPRREYQFDPAGQTYYMATNGSDANPGSLDQPWRTFAHALEELEPGDLLYVRAGDYPEPFVIRRSGSLGKPIILSAFPGERVHIFPPPGWEPAPGTTHGANTIQIDASHIWIHGFEIKGPPRELGFRPWGTPILSAIQLGGGSEGCRILNNNCYQSQYCGIKDQTGSFDYLVEGNVCFDNGTPIDETYPAGAALYLPGPAKTGTIVRGNALFRNGRAGFSHYHRPANHHVYNNVIFDNGTERGSFGLVTSGHHNVYAHNVVLDNVDGGISFFGAGAEGLPNDNLVINSIIADNSSYQLGKTDDPPLGNVVDFCLVSPSQTWASPLARISAISGPGMLFHSPLFEDESGRDYRNAAGGFGRFAAGSVALFGTRPQPHVGLFPATEYWEPTIAPFPNPTVDEGSELSFTVQLVGVIAPGTQIEFRLAAFPPRGASIDPQTGEFRWTPNEFQGPGVYRITVVATADNSPVVYGARTFSVTVNDVNSPPVIGLATSTNNSDFTGATDLVRNGYNWSPGILESVGNGAFRVTAFGGTQDYFSDLGFFAWREVSGDFDARVRISSLTAPSSFTKAGLMVRESLEPDSRMSLGHIYPSGMADDGYLAKNGYAFDRRLGTGTQTIPQMELSAGVPFPDAWLRLHRSGNLLSYYRGTNGTDWTLLLSQVTEPLPKVVYVGLATLTTQGETNVFTVADYHDFQIQHTVPQPVPEVMVTEGVPINLTFSAQDFDRPEQTLTFSFGSDAPAGATIGAMSGEFNWTPGESDGGDSFPITVVVADSGVPPLSATNTFTVVVNDMNSAPLLTLPLDATIDELRAYSANATANDADLPANSHIFELVSGPDGLAVSTAGGISWTPAEDQGPGNYPVIVRVVDDGSPSLSATNTFTVAVAEVNSPPVLTVINQVVDEGQTLIVVAGHDDDLPANVLAYQLANAPAAATIDAASGAFSWTPTESQGPGVYPITVIVTDNGSPSLSATNIFTVNVREVNTAPTVASISDQAMNEGATLALSLAQIGIGTTAGIQREVFNDIPGESVESLTNSTRFPDQPHSQTVLASFEAPQDLDDAYGQRLRGFLLPPATGDYRFWIAGDNQSALFLSSDESPSKRQLIASVSGWTNFREWNKYVEQQSQPVLLEAGKSYYVEALMKEGGGGDNLSVRWELPGGEIETPIPGSRLIAWTQGPLVLVNDSDVPAQELTFSLAPGAPAGAAIDPLSGEFNWTPGESDGGQSFPITAVVTDSGTPPLSATNSFTVTVNEVNSAPLLTLPPNATIDELTAYSAHATATDADLPANSLTFELISGPHGFAVSTAGAISWTPAEDQGPGNYPVTLRVVDDGSPSLSATNTFTVDVREVNAAPVLSEQTNRTIAELTLLTVTNAASDADYPVNSLTYSLVSAPADAEISPEGVISWTPSETNGPGTIVFTTRVTDDGIPNLSTTNSFMVTVSEVNAAPVLAAIGNRSVNESDLLTFLVSATDPNDLPANLVSLNVDSLPAGATFDPFSGVFGWTPNHDQQGNYLVTFTATDDGSPPLNDSEVITISVGDVNRPPVLPVLPDVTLSELTTLVVTNTATDADMPAQALTYALLSAPAGMSISTHGVIEWSPGEADGPGTNTVTTVATDDGTSPLSVTNTFAVIVDEVNVAPHLVLPIETNINELATFAAAATATDSDLPANPLIFALVNGPAGLTVSATGEINWVPVEDQGPSTNTVIISVTDTNPLAINTTSLSTTSSFQIVVSEVNTPPVLDEINDWIVNPGQPVLFTVAAMDSDLPTNLLAFSLIDPPPGAAIASADGQFLWRPTVAQAGLTQSVRVRVQDNGLPVLAATQASSVVVNPLTPVVLTAISFTNGVFRLQVDGIDGPDYVLMAATNHTGWTDLTTNTPPDVPFQFTDPQAGSFPTRAYRVRLQP